MMKYRRCARRNSGRSIEFSLVFETASGDLLTSPPLPDVTQVHETALRISRLLRLPDPEPAENSLDAVNAGIRLGKPSNPKRVRTYKILVVLLACALSVPFIPALVRQIVALRDRRLVARRDRRLRAAQISPSDECMLDRP